MKRLKELLDRKNARGLGRGPGTLRIIPVERIASRIYRIRGENVMLDADLAELYTASPQNGSMNR